MSDNSKLHFRPIAEPLDVDDAALDLINTKLGVPKLTKSVGNDTAPAIQRAPIDKLTIEVPDYLADALKRSALDGRTTVRHVVLAALRGQGFEIADVDMLPDGRRRQRT